MKKLGFALGSGGSRGVAHIGFLKAMEEGGIKPDFVSGTSMGSVVGSCYCLGMTPDEMADEVKKLKFSEIFDLSPAPIYNGALLRSVKMRKKLETYLKDYTFNDLKIPFRCVATDLVSGKATVLKDDDSLLDSVVASSSIPTIFKPVMKGEKVLVDGGIVCRLPINTVKKMGADVVVCVDVLGKVRPCDKKYNIWSVMLRMVDIADAELVKYKIKKIKPDLYIEPDLGDMSQYKFKDIEKAIDVGYEIGKANVDKIKALIGMD